MLLSSFIDTVLFFKMKAYLTFSARKPCLSSQRHLSLTVSWRYSQRSLHVCLCFCEFSVLLYQFTFMLYPCLGFVLFGWLCCALYVLFPDICTEYFKHHFWVEHTKVRNHNYRYFLLKCEMLLGFADTFFLRFVSRCRNERHESSCKCQHVRSNPRERWHDAGCVKGAKYSFNP